MSKEITVALNTGTELGLHVTLDLEVVGDDGVHGLFNGETLFWRR